MKKLLSLMLILTLMMSMCIYAYADDNAASVANQNESNKLKVVVDGKLVEFTDAEPVIKDGRTMIPFRAILEKLGAEVDYIDKTIIAKKNGVEINFKAGEKVINKKVNNNISQIAVDVPAYIDAKVNRTYVPVRFVAESLDCAVGWDNDDRCVVIIDKEKLNEELDKNFTKINEVLQANAKLEQAKIYKTGYSTDIMLDGFIELLNSENSIGLEFNNSSAHIESKDDLFKISANIDGKVYTNNFVDKDMSNEEEFIKELNNIFSNIDIDYISDNSTGKSYVKLNKNLMTYIFGLPKDLSNETEDAISKWIDTSDNEILDSNNESDFITGIYQIIYEENITAGKILANFLLPSIINDSDAYLRIQYNALLFSMFFGDIIFVPSAIETVYGFESDSTSLSNALESTIEQFKDKDFYRYEEFTEEYNPTISELAESEITLNSSFSLLDNDYNSFVNYKLSIPKLSYISLEVSSNTLQSEGIIHLNIPYLSDDETSQSTIEKIIIHIGFSSTAKEKSDTITLPSESDIISREDFSEAIEECNGMDDLLEDIDIE